MPELQVLESPREQASNEIIAWDFVWTLRLDGQTISSATATVTLLETNADVSSTCLQGSADIAGDTVTVTVKSLTAKKRYRVTVTAVLSGGTTQDADLILECPH